MKEDLKNEERERWLCFIMNGEVRGKGWINNKKNVKMKRGRFGGSKSERSCLLFLEMKQRGLSHLHLSLLLSQSYFFIFKKKKTLNSNIVDGQTRPNVSCSGPPSLSLFPSFREPSLTFTQFTFTFTQFTFWNHLRVPS